MNAPLPDQGAGSVPHAEATASIVVARVARAGFSFLGLYALGPALFGPMALALSVLGLAAQGVEITRRTFLRFARRREDHAGAVRGTRARAAAVVAVAGTATATVMVLALARRAGAAAGALAVLAAAPAALLAREAVRAWGALRRGRERPVVRVAVEPVAQLLLGGTALALAPGSAPAFAAAFVVGTVVATVARTLARATLDAPRAARREEARAGSPATEAREWLTYAAATAMGPMTHRASMHASVVVSGIVLGPGAAALLRVAHDAVDVAAVLPNAMRRGTLLAFDPDTEEEISPAAARAARRRGVVTGIPLLLGAAALAWPIGTLLAPGHPAVPASIACLALGTLGGLAFGPNDAVLRRIGTPRAVHTVIAASVASIALAVALTLALSPVLGLMGAAAALAVAQVLREAVLAAAVRREPLARAG
jgi:hypothetical protein